MPIPDLVDDTDASDKQWAREVARDELKNFGSIRFHPGHDTVTLDVPHRNVCIHLRDHCDGYSELRIEATFKIDDWDA